MHSSSDDPEHASLPSVAVVIPHHNAPDFLQACIAALETSTLRPEEVVVVDDGSTVPLPALSSTLPVRILRLPDGPLGPGRARNRGVAQTSAAIVFFVDADVTVHPDTLATLVRCLCAHDAAAAFGSYDAQPKAPGIVSRFRNLLHHYVHQHSSPDAGTFWAGCGIVRRDAFDAIGGFDERFTRPSIEDIDLGRRLRRDGRRIRLCPDAQATHLKRWTFAGMVRTDITARAIPWTRLLLQDGRLPSDLNLDRASRLGSAAAWAGVIALASFSTVGVIVAAAALVSIVWLHRRLYRFFWRTGGAVFACCSVALHILYLLYSSATFGVVAAGYYLQRAADAFARRAHQP